MPAAPVQGAGLLSIQVRPAVESLVSYATVS